MPEPSTLSLSITWRTRIMVGQGGGRREGTGTEEAGKTAASRRTPGPPDRPVAVKGDSLERGNQSCAACSPWPVRPLLPVTLRPLPRPGSKLLEPSEISTGHRPKGVLPLHPFPARLSDPFASGRVAHRHPAPGDRVRDRFREGPGARRDDGKTRGIGLERSQTEGFALGG